MQAHNFFSTDATPSHSSRKNLILNSKKSPGSTQEVSESQNRPATRGTAHSEVQGDDRGNDSGNDSGNDRPIAALHFCLCRARSAVCCRCVVLPRERKGGIPCHRRPDGPGEAEGNCLSTRSGGQLSYPPATADLGESPRSLRRPGLRDFMRCGPGPDVPEAVPDFVLWNNDRVRTASGATPRLLGTSVHAKTYLRTFPSCHRRAGNQYVCAARHPASVPQLWLSFLRNYGLSQHALPCYPGKTNDANRIAT